ncbi:amino acid ABC transporter permease [Gallibacterium salpingitidis]|uniref:Glutathione/L-cysteine transport system ATP-binding/permease protein CydC n=1 Tax=Gallibacterium salpingitidis TaxID=505341 RepID=A0AB36E1T1_9PAST|nr:cysteine/glutathione ABC transporter ATP-binding protein/permease CydC [Gallibacterium salpingitidis]OBX07812.1 amino acid ABC transporter permease [Gallibacterium salpingitidis]OBX09716.1 amino acid ABC transporter permease [Gallibacterium salpingitidis]WKT00862.1 cysteine/glutathione ABC transporter ATP-binding protein/permease CydC [Gallibacterium salpingitidis]
MRSLLPFLAMFKHTPTRLLLGIILMLTGLVASIGLLTLSGWFLAASAIAGVSILFNFFYPSSGVRGLAIGRTVARYFEKIVTHDVTFEILTKLRVQVFTKIIPLSPAVLSRYRNSELLNRLVADVDTLDTLYLRLFAPFVSAICMIIFIGIGLSFLNVSIALFVAGSLLALLLVIPTVFYRLGQKFGAQLTASRAKYRTQFVEYIQAQAELLLFNAGTTLQQRLQQTEGQWLQYQQREAQLAGLSNAILLLVNGLIVMTTLWLAAGTSMGEGDFKLALIALVTFSALASFEILMPIGAAFLHLGQVIASAQRVTEIINQQPLVQFNGNLEKVAADQQQPLLVLKQVNFAYPMLTEQVLSDINLSFATGEKVAILGKTGSGKSTLLQLLIRNYEATQGQILLSGYPIAEYSENALRQQMVLLTQRVHIFSDTLRQNLLLANEAATDQQLAELLHKVGLDYLLYQEQGLDTWLGDGGRTLSGGEQRRLGIARILLSTAPIILLDEPTEGLDRETERQVLALLLQHCQDKTLIMVTHRLTALEQFDRVIVMDNAQVVEQGDFSALSQTQDSFLFKLVNRISY